MSDLTTELNLVLCQDNDDTADYLTQSAGLRGSLNTVDGLFSSTTGHNHNGAHQGGNFTTLAISGDLTIGGNFQANGTLTSLGAAHFPTLNVDGATTLGSLTVSGAATINGAATVSGRLTTSDSLAATGFVAAGPVISAVAGDLNANRGNGQGYVFLANGSHYVGFDGTNYQMPSANLVVNGDTVILASATQTLYNKTLSAPYLASPTLASPAMSNAVVTNVTLSGQVAGQPTWNSSQTFPALTSSADITTGGSFFITQAQNASLGRSSRSGANSAEVQISNYLYVPGDIYSALRMYAIQFVVTSDPRLKRNMAVVPDDDCMSRIRCPVPVQTYQMEVPDIEAPKPHAWDIGFSAPDMADCSPEFVSRDAEGTPAGLNYANMAALLWGALRQLDARCQAKGI